MGYLTSTIFQFINVSLPKVINGFVNKDEELLIKDEELLVGKEELTVGITLSGMQMIEYYGIEDCWDVEREVVGL